MPPRRQARVAQDGSSSSSSSISEGIAHATLSLLPSDIIGRIYDRLSLTDVRSCLCCARTFRNGVSSASRLVIGSPNELDCRFLRRFANVSELRVYCLFEEVPVQGDDDGMVHHLNAHVAQVAVPVLCSLPNLRRAFFGTADGYIADATEAHDVAFALEACFQVRNADGATLSAGPSEGDTDEAVMEAAGKVLGAAQDALCAAYRCGALSPALRVEGIFVANTCGVAAPGAGENSCVRCNDNARSLPPDVVLSSRSSFGAFCFSCLSTKCRIGIAAERGADLNGIDGIPSHLLLSAYLPYNRLGADGDVEDCAFAGKVSTRTLAMLRELVRLGADPTREEALSAFLQEKPECGAWYKHRGRVQITRGTFEALRAVGLPLREEQVDVIDFTDVRMIHGMNRARHDGQSTLAWYGRGDHGVHQCPATDSEREDEAEVEGEEWE